jgi:putative PIN family toxin of toxin-antitoxin system
MNKIVIDTNILISSRLSDLGNPNMIMELIFLGELELYYSPDILDEYERVLAYKKLKISSQNQEEAINDIKDIGNLTTYIEKSTISLPDESDRIFYDLAKEVGATLITGNKKHYPDEGFIMTPAEFLQTF